MEEPTGRKSVNSSSMEPLKASARESGQRLADTAAAHMGQAFDKQLHSNIDLWVRSHHPDNYKELGHLAGQVYQSGKRQAAKEFSTYSLILISCISFGLYLVESPFWLFLAGVLISIGIALGLSLSGNS
ncbi:hypothetical protein [Okeania sp. SIO1H2]|uniref:hypothetical protein n=1 Tax=Okeania sp. SIO1H2 TaxID=2607775 RepID=UPI00141C50B1|nr:hypothetical protein [Okeania sp. SIO1H2]NET97580.1 hypothetical protein [Okeania sp. SIO1H2]